MPPRVGDPGLFICSIPAGPDVKKPTPAIHVSAPPNAWLILAMCEHCNVKTHRYCTDHDRNNWWFTKSGLGFGRPNPRITPAQRGVRSTEPQTRPEGLPR